MALKTILISVFALVTNAFAHGENKPGPHGGAIQMPSGFHVEFVVRPDGNWEVYLLDINFKKATTKNSSVKVHIEEAMIKVPVACKPAGDHFLCSTKGLPKTKEVFIRAKRGDMTATADAKFRLP